MEIIRGKQTSFMDMHALSKQLSGCESVHIDIGTGDGRYVQHIAQTYPRRYVIGIDTCRENLRNVSRRAPDNALFVIANAQRLPTELYGLAAQITINFPWGSLLKGLLDDDSSLLEGLVAISLPHAEVHVRLNAGALAEVGWSLETGADRVRQALAMHGFDLKTPLALFSHDLRSLPTTWAKRLAFGRDPRAIYVQGKRSALDIARILNTEMRA